MLRVWTLLPTSSEQRRQARSALALALGVFLIAMIVVTGSRAGLALGLLGAIAAATLAPTRSVALPQRRQTLIRTGAAVAVAATPLLIFLAGRASAIQRLLQSNAFETEARFQRIPLMLRITREQLPFGTGFGSFDPVFRLYEPDAMLGPQYFNHAHNEPLELVITGGIPAIALLVVFLIWFGRAAYAMFSSRRAQGSVLFGRLGVVIATLLMLASLVDYPLRTPLLAAFFAIACCWLARGQCDVRQP